MSERRVVVDSPAGTSSSMPLQRRRTSFRGTRSSSSLDSPSASRTNVMGSLIRTPGVYVGTTPSGGIGGLGARVTRRALGISSVFLQGLRSSGLAAVPAPGLERDHASVEDLGGCLVEYMAKVHALEQVSQELETQLRMHLESKAKRSGGWGALRASWASSCQQHLKDSTVHTIYNIVLSGFPGAAVPLPSTWARQPRCAQCSQPPGIQSSLTDTSRSGLHVPNSDPLPFVASFSPSAASSCPACLLTLLTLRNAESCQSHSGKWGHLCPGISYYLQGDNGGLSEKQARGQEGKEWVLSCVSTALSLLPLSSGNRWEKSQVVAPRKTWTPSPLLRQKAKHKLGMRPSPCPGATEGRTEGQQAHCESQCKRKQPRARQGRSCRGKKGDHRGSQWRSRTLAASPGGNSSSPLYQPRLSAQAGEIKMTERHKG
ncbi:Hypothetical predicted protein [Marmota monax]|uniref:IF rod domain-containing protein n=1 Tax=Marmota monax TaxID=9995 RepID=A0A5E4C135_MARMO|nr:hypothetical protein GHT09_009670 [Marmota monax]VTJ75515.1 Hypothetical predicted protein [Marmota monax]